MQNPCRQSGDQRPAIGRAPFPAARSSRPLAKATTRRLLAPPSHPEMNGHPSGPCDRLVAAAAEGPHAQKPHPGPSRRPPLGMEGRGRGRGRQWRRPAAPAHGREGTNRAAGAPRRGGTEQRTPSRTPSPGGQAMEERGTGGGGMAAASPKSRPPPLHEREGEEGARAGPHPRPRPLAIPASRRGGGGSSPASAPREGEGPGHRRATPAGGCNQRRPRAPPLGPAVEVAPGFSCTRPPGEEAGGGREPRRSLLPLAPTALRTCGARHFVRRQAPWSEPRCSPTLLRSLAASPHARAKVTSVPAARELPHAEPHAPRSSPRTPPI